MSEESVRNLVNQFTNDYTRTGIGDLLKEGAAFSDLMILLENCTLATMMVNHQHFKMAPHVSSVLVEMALQRAMERFTEINNEGSRQ